MVQGGIVPIVSVLLQVFEQPFFVTVTEYVPAVFTVMQRVVAPVLHRYVLPNPTGAQSELEPPGQMMLLPVMVQFGGGTMVTVFSQ